MRCQISQCRSILISCFISTPPYLDYYTIENGDNIQIRWSGRDQEGKMEHSIFCLDEHGKYEYTFSEEQEKELYERNTEIRLILQDGEKIYESVYE